jgi:hypothetical protein
VRWSGSGEPGCGGLFQNEETKIDREKFRRVRAAKAGGAVPSVTPMLGLGWLFPGSPPPAYPAPAGPHPWPKADHWAATLRFSILKETPTPRQNDGKIVFGQGCGSIFPEKELLVSPFRLPHKLPLRKLSCDLILLA